MPVDRGRLASFESAERARGRILTPITTSNKPEDPVEAGRPS
jgi:hypothetical protein